VEKPTVQLVKKFSTFCGTRGFITVFTTGQHHSQTNPFTTFQFYLFNIHFNIILPPTTRSSKMCLSFTFPHQNLYVFLFSPIQETPLILFIQNCTKHHNCISFWWHHQSSVHSRSTVLTQPHGEMYPCSCVTHCCNLACQYIQHIWADKVLEHCSPSI